MTRIISAGQEPHTQRVFDDIQEINPGDWYWFKHKLSETFDSEEILCCVYHVGSNYAKIEHPGGWEWRVHFNEWHDVCRYEPSPQTWFDQWADEQKREIKRINAEIHDICVRLGVDPTGKRISAPGGGGNLAVVSSAVDTSQYKAALIKAKDEDLPALFKQIKVHSEELTRWMTASIMSMKAKCGDMGKAVDSIEEKILTISIYAGLVENIVQVKNGQPAGMGDKLHIMQGKLFMDEECLLNYSHGGMEFDDISEFDEWLARPDNMNRILPFPRCMVSFQVRRYEKHREHNGCLETAWINFQLAEADKLTFLYIRNGERLYRLDTDIKFGNELFADRDQFNFTEPRMVNNRDHNHATIPVREYEERVRKFRLRRKQRDKELKQYRQQHKLFLEWQEKNPDADDEESGFDYKYRSPFPPHEPYHSFCPTDWAPLDDNNVFLDDVNDSIRKEANHYNQISALIQGLLDRSDVLHPHLPAKLWTPQGFDQLIELVYDHDRTLYSGAEPPSWKDYKESCNASLGVGSVVVGQQKFWRASLPREQGNYRNNYKDYIKDIYTEGNPGPGMVSEVREWSARSRKATFRWLQVRYVYRRGWQKRSGETEIKRSISVPASELFNISGYKPGDYKQFFNDPRTRRKYLEWAHLLLTAEEYHAGNLDVETGRKRKPKENC